MSGYPANKTGVASDVPSDADVASRWTRQRFFESDYPGGKTTVDAGDLAFGYVFIESDGTVWQYGGDGTTNVEGDWTDEIDVATQVELVTKADLDAGNLSAGNVTSWQAALGVGSSGSIVDFSSAITVVAATTISRANFYRFTGTGSTTQALPSAASSNGLFVVIGVSDSATANLTITGDFQTTTGSTNSTTANKLMIPCEWVIVRSDGTHWIKVAGKSVLLETKASTSATNIPSNSNISLASITPTRENKCSIRGWARTTNTPTLVGQEGYRCSTVLGANGNSTQIVANNPVMSIIGNNPAWGAPVNDVLVIDPTQSVSLSVSNNTGVTITIIAQTDSLILSEVGGW